jgi:nicotinamidase-related amidase
MTFEPYPWPYDGQPDPDHLALVVAGAQTVWAARSTRAADVATILLGVAAELRAAGALVVLVRHGARPGRRPVALPPPPGSDDWRLAFDPEVADLVVDATGVDGFHGGPLDDALRSRGITHLVLGGFGHEAAVDSTLRSANDRGYECLVLTDGVAPFDKHLGARALHSVTMSGGIFGAIGSSSSLLSSLRPHLEAAS